MSQSFQVEADEYCFPRQTQCQCKMTDLKSAVTNLRPIVPVSHRICICLKCQHKNQIEFQKHHRPFQPNLSKKESPVDAMWRVTSRCTIDAKRTHIGLEKVLERNTSTEILKS